MQCECNPRGGFPHALAVADIGKKIMEVVRKRIQREERQVCERRDHRRSFKKNCIC